MNRKTPLLNSQTSLSRHISNCGSIIQQPNQFVDKEFIRYSSPGGHFVESGTIRNIKVENGQLRIGVDYELDDNEIVYQTFAFENCTKHIHVIKGIKGIKGIVFYEYASKDAEDKEYTRIQAQESAHKQGIKIKKGGHGSTTMHKSDRIHTNSKGVKRVVYTKNGNNYVKIKNKNTGKFDYKKL